MAKLESVNFVDNPVCGNEQHKLALMLACSSDALVSLDGEPPSGTLKRAASQYEWVHGEYVTHSSTASRQSVLMLGLS